MRTKTLAAVVAGIGTLGWATTAQAQTVRVALLPIVVNSSLTETEYLSKGLADMISARLEKSGEIVVVRAEEGAIDLEAAIAAGEDAGAEFVVYGSYTQFGDGASLDLRAASVASGTKSNPRRVFVQAGSPAEIIPKLDDLSERVARYMVGAAVSAGPAIDPSAAAPAAGAQTPSQATLEARIEALERVVFPEGGSQTTADE